MKKILMMIVAALLVAAPVAMGQSKALNKALNKEKKEKMKEYKKEGWKLFGSSRSLEVALLKHYEKLNELGDDGREVVGIASRFKSKNVGKQMAANNAAISYAQTAGSALKGRVVSDISADGTSAENEFDHFYAAYERLVEKEIKGEMEPSYAIIRDLGDGTYELQEFYIVSESAASKARISALENAMKESEVAAAHAEKIANFVREGFEAE